MLVQRIIYFVNLPILGIYERSRLIISVVGDEMRKLLIVLLTIPFMFFNGTSPERQVAETVSVDMSHSVMEEWDAVNGYLVVHNVKKTETEVCELDHDGRVAE